jgi:hypothetical protein
MDNALKNSNTKFILIGKINGLAAQAKKTRNRIKTAKTEQRVWRLAYRKHVVGIDIRHHLLAYAFLRGTPYRKVESKCGEFNKPSADLIFKVIEQHAPYYVSYEWKPGSVGFKSYKPTLNDVHVWLAAPEVL